MYSQCLKSKKKFPKNFTNIFQFWLLHVIDNYTQNEKEPNVTNGVTNHEPCINFAIKNTNNIE
ncbi:hypothetical protein BpHYR1_036960 [Brachionus plicatilis]|uniref:Uncharacterized protein n=1 Tax=Brachionus plicatilis TaxID=10195 RepID=A0A3M7S928_BRAPC|nr:hypothetical protein BpHYR1_036960 [Brachionus plicatilis]